MNSSKNLGHLSAKEENILNKDAHHKLKGHWVLKFPLFSELEKWHNYIPPCTFARGVIRGKDGTRCESAEKGCKQHPKRYARGPAIAVFD